VPQIGSQDGLAFVSVGSFFGALLLVLGAPANGFGQDPTSPRVVVDGVQLTLYCEHPDIATPVALDVDTRGRIWVIESNTHFQPEGYTRHATDRVLILSGTKNDGRVKTITPFTEGLTHSMGLAWYDTGQVLLATRRDIMLLEDTDENDRADKKSYLARLETTSKYPHNGLTGFAVDALGFIYFALGENETADYRLVGTDGRVVTGGPDGGCIFRMRPDGSEIERWAIGFWNTFHLAFDGFGRLFAVDNDPDSRPPCRLLHIIQSGDYGYRRWQGRKGLHPFTSWNGELRGTLPMVAGTGEAPSGILPYEHTELPAALASSLLVTSWGDHRVEMYKLNRRGASFRSSTRPVVVGGESFRPVGIAMAPDGTVFFSDWVDRSYTLHSKGRIWRMTGKTPGTTPVDQSLETLPAAVPTTQDLDRMLTDPIRKRREAAVRRTSQANGVRDMVVDILQSGSTVHSRHHALQILSIRGELTVENLRAAARDEAPEIRAKAAQLGNELGENHVAILLSLLEDKDPAVQTAAAIALRRTNLKASPHGLGSVEPFQNYRAAQVVARLRTLLTSPDPFVASSARLTLAYMIDTKSLLAMTRDAPPEMREDYLLTLRAQGGDEAESILPEALTDTESSVRRAALQWIGQENLNRFENDLDHALTAGPVTPELLDAYLATHGLLQGLSAQTRDQVGRDAFLVEIIKDDTRPRELRTTAMRCVSPTHDTLTAEVFRTLLEDASDVEFRKEIVRTLWMGGRKESEEVLSNLVADEHETTVIRREAIVGLAQHLPGTRETLNNYTTSKHANLKSEAERALRLFDVDAVAPPKGIGDASRTLLLNGGNTDEGERLFFHPLATRCASCHSVKGRGSSTGPDLSTIGNRPREKILEAIVAPSLEIAPQFTSWVVITAEATLSGIVLNEEANGTIRIAQGDGSVLTIPIDQIVSREPTKQSMMPADLTLPLSDEELRDLVAFLASLR